jgi:hypothetical protein
MGAGALAGVSVVSGLVGFSQQQKSANAQKQALRSQQEEQALQAQLQLLALENSRLSSGLQDFLDDATRKLAYQQTTTQLTAQQAQNDIAVSNATFDASVQRIMSDVTQANANLETTEATNQANLQAEADSIGVQQGVVEADNQLMQALGESFGGVGNRQNSIAALLNAASATGGVNEALALLLDTDSAEIQRLIGAEERQQQLGEQTNSLAAGTERATIADNNARANSANLSNQLTATATNYESDKLRQDALYSQQIANAGFQSQRAALEGGNNIGILADRSSRVSRDYLRAANTEAVKRGAKLSDNILKAQADQVRTPGFFDLLGVAGQGYSTYTNFKQYD